MGRGGPGQPADQDPRHHRGRARDHRRPRRGDQRQRHADLRPGPLPRCHGGLRRRAGEGSRQRPRPVRHPLGRVVLRVPRGHRDRQAARGHRRRRGARPARQGGRGQRPSSPTATSRSSSAASAGRPSPRPAPTAAAAVGLHRRQEPRLPRHDVRHRPGRGRHRQHDAGEDPGGLRRPRRGRGRPGHHDVRRGAGRDGPARRRRHRLRRRDRHPRAGGRREVRGLLGRAPRHRVRPAQKAARRGNLGATSVARRPGDHAGVVGARRPRGEASRPTCGRGSPTTRAGWSAHPHGRRPATSTCPRTSSTTTCSPRCWRWPTRSGWPSAATRCSAASTSTSPRTGRCCTRRCGCRPARRWRSTARTSWPTCTRCSTGSTPSPSGCAPARGPA